METKLNNVYPIEIDVRCAFLGHRTHHIYLYGLSTVFILKQYRPTSLFINLTYNAWYEIDNYHANDSSPNSTDK